MTDTDERNKYMKSQSNSYKEAGVDITAGYRAVELMKSHIGRTMTPGAISGIGDYAANLSLANLINSGALPFDIEVKSRCS